MIDCMTFRLPLPKEFHVSEVSPTFVKAHVWKGFQGIRLSVDVRISLNEKAGNAWGTTFPQCADWLFKHDREDVDFVHLAIDGHTAWLGSAMEAGNYSEPEERMQERAVIDLDDNHYWTFDASYYIKKVKLRSDAGAKAVAEMREYLQNIVKGVQFLGGYAEAIRQKDAPQGKPVDDAAYLTVEQQTADPFHARHYPEFFARLQDELAKHPELLPYEAGICANARLTIGFKAYAVDDYSEKGNTRFFGLPDLPPDVAYPKIEFDNKENEGNLCKFIAQINFSELKGLCDYLPERGILYLFIDSQYDHFNTSKGDRFQKSLYRHKIFYWDGDVDELTSAKDLDIKPEYIHDVHAGYEGEDGGAQPARVEIFPCVCIMNYDHFDEDENGKVLAPCYPPLIIDEDQYVSIRQFNYALLGAHDHFHNAINGSVEDVYHGSPYTQAAHALGGNPEDYVLLLQVSGDSEYSGYQFEDADTLYVVIHKEKLKALDFSQTYCTTTWWWGTFGSDYE